MKILYVALLALGIMAGALAPNAQADTGAEVYYLSLGDSVASGYQPVGGPPNTCLGTSGYNQGYADQLYKIARSEITGLRLVKLGCAGETTESMISRACGAFCPYPEGSQLAQAVAFLETHAGQVAFITIDLGGNDFLENCDPSDVACITAIIPTIQANLTTILETVQDAAPGVPVYGMNYYNPFLAAWLAGPEGEAFALQSEQAASVLRAGLVATYGANGAEVADVAAAFDVTNFDDEEMLKGVGPVPVNVARTCAWTWACDRPPHGGDIHPNNEGYSVIARTLAELVLP